MKCVTHDSALNRSVQIGYILLVICLTQQTLAFGNSTSAFVERCRADCSFDKSLISCGKYRVVKWLHENFRNKEFAYGPVRIIRIPTITHQSILPKLPQSRVFKSGAIEALNFLRDVLEDLLTKRALVYTIDNSVAGRNFGTVPMIMDEDEVARMQSGKNPDGEWRIFKKKKSLILPILILLNLLKLKLLLLPIFLGVHFIKKLLVLASLIAPSVLSHLKICKVAPHPQPYQMWATAAEAPVDYPTGYGQEEPWVHRNDLVYGTYHGLRNPYG